MKRHGHRYAGNSAIEPRNARRFGAIFSPPSPPELQPAPPPPPTPEDPAVVEARHKKRLAEARRRGRQATILTGGQGDSGTAPVNRPQLRRLLGGG